MAQVLARVRNTGAANLRLLVDHHDNALDEGVAAWRAVQEEADGAVQGGALGGAAGDLHRLVEGGSGAAVHLDLGRAEGDGEARVAGDDVGFDDHIEVLQPTDNGFGHRVSVGANDDAASGSGHGRGLARGIEALDVDANDADALGLKGLDGVAQGVPAAGVVAGRVADENNDPATVAAEGDSTRRQLIERVDPVLGEVPAAHRLQ